VQIVIEFDKGTSSGATLSLIKKIGKALRDADINYSEIKLKLTSKK
jgi:hypothetical protein